MGFVVYLFIGEEGGFCCSVIGEYLNWFPKPAPTIVPKPAPTIVPKPAPTIVPKPAPTIDLLLFYYDKSLYGNRN